ncbi:MAG TPA: cytochrome C [Hyphomicrobiaceae bacterium]|nr:cytochrome C [Hyphomicrobiaceae bacterium]
MKRFQSRRLAPGICAMALVAIAALTGNLKMAAASDEHLGLTEYEVACMPCHGATGRGDGPLAKQTQKPPPDLTRIARLNGGTFPSQRISGMIDGRVAVAEHGARDMPVWGDRYRASGDPADNKRTIEARARARIQALVRFLEAIQQQ